MLETRFPRIPGDGGNARTWPFPMLYKVIAGATPERVVRRNAEELLDAFIDEQLARTGLGPERLALVGFSQGTMMSLYVAPRRPQAVAGVLGFSGAMIGAETLDAEITAKPPVMLIHGDADDLVPVASVLQAAGALGQAGVTAQWHICHRLGHSIDQDGLELGGQFLRDCFAGF